MKDHAKKCVEQYCELIHRLYKVSTPCIHDHHFEEETKSVGECRMCALNCSELL